MTDRSPFENVLRAATRLDLKNLKPLLVNASQWELNYVLWGFVHHVFTCTPPESDKYWLESAEPVLRMLTFKSANPFFKHPRYLRSAFDIVNDYCLASHATLARYKKMAMFFRTHFRMLNSNNAYDMHNNSKVTISSSFNVQPRGYVLPSKHVMTKELHAMLETLERMDQVVKSHLEVHSVRVGKLSPLLNDVSMDRVVMSDILYWLENWVQRYDIADADTQTLDSKDRFRKAVMQTTTQEEKQRWMRIFKTLMKWFSYGSPNLVTENVMDALQRTNDEQMMESIRIQKEIDKLSEMQSYHVLPVEEGEDLKKAMDALKMDKCALEYRFGELETIIQKNKSDVIHISTTTTTSSTDIAAAAAATLDLKKFSNLTLVPGKYVKTGSKEKYYLLSSKLGLENRGEDEKRRLRELARWMQEHANDPFFFQTLHGYVDDVNMFGLVMERVKCTLEMRLDPDFFKKYTSFFEKKRKFFIKKSEAVMIAYRLFKGMEKLNSKNIFLQDLIDSKNVMLKLDNGVWIGKWIIPEIPCRKETYPKTKYTSTSDAESFKLLVKDVFKLADMEHEAETETSLSLEFWINSLRRKYIEN